MAIDLSMMIGIEGMGIDINFLTEEGFSDLKCSSTGTIHTALTASEILEYQPTFLLVFKDGEELEFEACDHEICFEWIFRISVMRINYGYLQYLQFMDRLKAFTSIGM